jgi:hypothetical protein
MEWVLRKMGLEATVRWRGDPRSSEGGGVERRETASSAGGVSRGCTAGARYGREGLSRGELVGAAIQYVIEPTPVLDIAGTQPLLDAVRGPTEGHGDHRIRGRPRDAGVVRSDRRARTSASGRPHRRAARDESRVWNVVRPNFARPKAKVQVAVLRPSSAA